MDTGGIAGRGLDLVDTAAQMGAVGLDPWLFLNSKSDEERIIILQLAKRMSKYKQDLDKALASYIAEIIVKAMGGR